MNRLATMIGLASILLFFGCGSWNKTEITKEIAWETLHAIDWRQTLQIAGDPDNHYESGPARYFIGEHPSTGDVNTFMATTAILHPIITNALPRKYTIGGFELKPRAWFQNISIGGSAYLVGVNFSIGLDGDF